MENQTIKEHYITVKTAILAKEKGFNVPVLNYFDGSDMLASQAKGPYDLHNYNSSKGSTLRSAPSQTILQEWLLLNFDIRVWWEYDNKKGKYYWWVDWDNLPDEDITDKKIYFDTHFEALEDALYEGLLYVK